MIISPQTIKIVLASTSPYRKELLKRLGIKFTTASPKINEDHIQGEKIDEYVKRLSKSKVLNIINDHEKSIIIGSDQALVCDEKILGKPGNYENAKIQLDFMNNKTVSFYTGLYVVNTETKTSKVDVIQYDVEFRKLTNLEINNYLIREKPYDCAGSFKSEKLGISLLKSMHGDDVTALIGLPLIRLSELLRNEGVSIP